MALLGFRSLPFIPITLFWNDLFTSLSLDGKLLEDRDYIFLLHSSLIVCGRERSNMNRTEN